ncbi:MAG: NAD(P)H-binding protein [Pseudomonadota bacterium]
MRVLLAGATGTIGRAARTELGLRGHAVTALLRVGSVDPSELPATYEDPTALAETVGAAGPFDAVLSCLASRTGQTADAWAVEYEAQSALLNAARKAGTPRFVLLSAICVQKPRLAFQHAKLAFEAELQASDLSWSIVRPTAFFKSLSGQVLRVASGKPFLVFGNGLLTACKPISDEDLARYLVDLIEEPARAGKIHTVGGPGPAITPADQAAMLGELLGRPVPLRRVPPTLLSIIAATLGAAGRIRPRLAERAELARIGHYYATESMLVWDAAAGRYDADATPEFGQDRLQDHYARVLAGTTEIDLGAHGFF